MSHVASLELSKKLYELSGWKLGKFGWTFWDKDGILATRIDLADEPQNILCPAYDCGYLLKKLHEYIEKLMPQSQMRWAIEYYDEPLKPAYIYGDTIEDALASLAIKLFEKGALTNGK